MNQSVWKKISQIITVLIVLFWGYITYRVGDYKLLLIAFIFLVVLMIIRKPNLFFVSLPILFIIILFSSTIDAWSSLKENNLSLAQDPVRLLRKMLTPGTGTEALPPEIQHLHTLLERNEIPDYRLSPKLTENPLFFQRAIESSWPVRLTEESKYLFGFIDEFSNYPNCKPINEIMDIQLGYCP